MDEALRLTGYASSFRDHAGQNVQWTLSRSLLRSGHLRIKHGAPSVSRTIYPENRVQEIRTPGSETKRLNRPGSPTEGQSEIRLVFNLSPNRLFFGDTNWKSLGS